MERWMEETKMYRAYWGMEFNPFDKELQEKKFYQGIDYTEMMKRLEYLRNIRGIGHDFIIRPGAHNPRYWNNAIDYQVLFFKKFFNKSK